MKMKVRLWGIATSLAMVVSGLVSLPISASAYSGSVITGTGTSTSQFQTPTAQGTTSISSPQPFAFDYPGGMFEVTAASASTTLNIQAFKDGAMDTSFNSTGSLSFTAQIAQNNRTFLRMTTYANGAKWAIFDYNALTVSGNNYIYLGTFSGGYQSTITLPTTNSLYTECQAKTGGSFTVLTYELLMVPHTGFSAPLLRLRCNGYLTANGSTYMTDLSYLVNYTGGTVLGTPASWSYVSATSISPTLNTTTAKTITNFGVSVNPAATGSQVALTYLYATTAGTSSTNPAYDQTTVYTDYVVVRVTAAGAITQTTSAWTGISVGSITGSVVIYPRNNGTVYAIQGAHDGWNAYTFRVLTFGTSGAATAVTITGASMRPGYSRVPLSQSPSSTLKAAAISIGSTSYYAEINASTGVATERALFTPIGGNSYDSFNWQIADNTNGLDFYIRTSPTYVRRVLTSAAPTAPVAPAAPSVVVGDAQATVSWSAPSDGGAAISAYTVEFSSNSGSSWSTWANNIATTSTTVTGLTNGTAYIFRVSATNAVGTSSASASSSSATPNPVPGSPTGLAVAGNGSNSVSLSWTAPTPLNSLTDYLIQYSTDGGTTWTTYVDGVSTATTATVSGLTTGSSYRFRVSGSNAIGAGSASTATTSITAATVPANVASAPTLAAQPGEIIVTWTTPANGGSALTSALLQYSNNGTVWTDYTGTVDLSGTITMTGLTAGLSYYTRVKAANFFGPGAAWSAASTAVTALPATAPGTVTNVVATTGSSGGSVALTWTAPAANGSAITDYTIQYSSDGGVTWSTWAHSPSTSTSANITGLTPGTNYVFRVTAVNGVGSSSPNAATTPVAAAAQSAPPAAPVPDPVKLPTNIQVNKKVDAAEGKVVIGGENMQDVKTVLMNNIESTILDRTSQNITVAIPKQVIGWVDVEFITATGKLRFESLIFVENVKANQLAKLRLGFASDTSLKTASSNRFTALSPKFKSAVTATCVGHYSKSISRQQAIMRAKHACGLVLGSTRKATVRIALSKQQLHAHVLVLFDY